MHIFRSTFTFLLFIGTSLVLSSQVQNLELLDHTEHRTILTSLFYDSGDLIYTVINDQRGRGLTQVKVKSGQGFPQDLLTEDLRFSSDSKLFYDSNGGTRMYLFGLSDPGFDASSTDFVEVKKINGSYSASIIKNQFFISPEVVRSIALDSLDRVYTLTGYPRLQVFVGDSLVNEVFPSQRSGYLHSNKKGEVFLLDSGLDTIYRVADNLQLDFVKKLKVDFREIKNIGDQIWVLENSQNIYAYTTDFSAEPTKLNLPFPISSLDQVSAHNGEVFLLNPKTTGFELFQYQSGNTTRITNIDEDFASSSRLHIVSDSLFLTTGQYEINDISNQAFIRGYNLNQEFRPIRTMVDLNRFDLFYLKDTVISGAPDNLWLYGVNYELENNSAFDSNLSSVYTSDLVPQLSISETLFDHQLNSIIPPTEIIEVDTSRLIAHYHPTTAMAAVPGSNYRFNEAFGIIPIGITTSISEALSSEFNVFPNPFTHNIDVQLESNTLLKLFNLNGELLFEGRPEKLRQKDFSHLLEGIYFLQIGNAHQSIKLVKAR